MGDATAREQTAAAWNVDELPTAEGLQALAPEKDGPAIRRSMARLRIHIDDAKEARAPAPASSLASVPPRRAQAAAFAPANTAATLITPRHKSEPHSRLELRRIAANCAEP